MTGKMNDSIMYGKDPMMTCPIVDTTLRDGEQAPDVVFTTEERVEIFEQLVAIGVLEIELGVSHLPEFLSSCPASLMDRWVHLGGKIIAWCRAVKGDVEAALDDKADIIHIGMPISPLQLASLGIEPSAAFARLEPLLRMVRSASKTMSVGAQDATRAETTFLNHFVAEAVRCEVSRVRLADTVGIAHPAVVYDLVSRIRAAFPKVLFEFHSHDDFGMAAANAIAALTAGAHRVSTTVLGIGERAGNAPMECVVAAAEKLLGMRTGIDMTKMSSLCRTVATCACRPIPASHPIVGSRVFTHESGVHTHGQLFDTHCYQPLRAEMIGHDPSMFLFGKNTGRAAVRHLLINAGVSFNEELVETITRGVRESSVATKSVFTGEEVIERVRHMGFIGAAHG